MPAGISMLPAEMTLRPNATPYLPRPRTGATVPVVKPRQLVRIGNGDTLRLTAGIVRRPFKGDTLTMFAFNGQQPGPLLQVAQGAEVIVELTNALDQPTTVHWHGIRLENAFDGVPDLTQQPVAPGSTAVRRITCPEGKRALSGGFEMSGELVTIHSAPSGTGTAWDFWIHNPTSSTQTLGYTMAVCG